MEQMINDEEHILFRNGDAHEEMSWFGGYKVIYMITILKGGLYGKSIN